jgi:4-amino-4-deoxy-L-arabinose transferase-like glycosyltransferase
MKLWQQVVLILTICYFSFFVHITADEIDVMEARNYVSAREMVKDGTWLLPTMNGELRIAKPPLPTWITAGIRMLSGDTDDLLTMRLPAAVIGTLMVLAVFGFVRTIQTHSIIAFYTATIFASNALVIVMGRRNTWDIYAVFFMMITIWALWHGWSEQKESLLSFGIAGIAAGLSFLSKGPVDFYSFLLPFVVAYIAVYGAGPVRRKKTGLAIFILIAVAIGGAWPMYVYLKTPDISAAVAREEVSAWSYDYARPFHYYLNFPIYAGIWILFFAAYFIPPFAKPRVGIIMKYDFPLVWFIAILVLVSITPSKKESYFMPAAVPMSIMAGLIFYAVADVFKQGRPVKGDRTLIAIHTALLCLISLSIPFVYHFFHANLRINSASWIGLFAVFCLTAILALRSGFKKRFVSLFACTQILLCLALLFFWPAIAAKDHKNTEYKSIREIINIKSVKGLPFYSASPVNIGVVWDVGQKVNPWPYAESPIPAGRQFVLLFADETSVSEFAEKYGGKIRLTVIDTYKWDPTNLRRIVVAALVQIK